MRDSGIARRIADAVPVASGLTIIEVGPGRGVLTGIIARRACDAGASFICIERDPELASALRGRAWAESAGKPPRIITGDVRTALPDIAAGMRRDERYVVFGNLPYYLTGRLFRILGELPRLPDAAVFMVQREVALRIAAGPPKMNLLAASVQVWANASILFTVPAGAFSPTPKVESAVVFIASTQAAPPLPGYYRAARALFKQPRKTVLNNLSAAIGREEALAAIAAAGINPGIRPQTLTPETILYVSKRPQFANGGRKR